MAKASVSRVVREILTDDPEIDTAEVMRLAAARGLKATEKQIKKSVNNQRTAIRAQVATARVAPAAAQETAPPKAAPAPVAASSTAPDLAGVLGNIVLVNTVVGLCGGVENARQTAEAVQACGGVEAFLRHLEVVATIRGGEAAR